VDGGSAIYGILLIRRRKGTTRDGGTHCLNEIDHTGRVPTREIGNVDEAAHFSG
jgi:hypothetical protein